MSENYVKDSAGMITYTNASVGRIKAINKAGDVIQWLPISVQDYEGLRDMPKESLQAIVQESGETLYFANVSANREGCGYRVVEFEGEEVDDDSYDDGQDISTVIGNRMMKPPDDEVQLLPNTDCPKNIPVDTTSPHGDAVENNIPDNTVTLKAFAKISENMDKLRNYHATHPDTDGCGEHEPITRPEFDKLSDIEKAMYNKKLGEKAYNEIQALKSHIVKLEGMLTIEKNRKDYWRNLHDLLHKKYDLLTLNFDIVLNFCSDKFND